MRSLAPHGNCCADHDYCETAHQPRLGNERCEPGAQKRAGHAENPEHQCLTQPRLPESDPRESAEAGRHGDDSEGRCRRLEGREIEQVQECRHRKHRPASADEAKDGADGEADEEGFEDDQDEGPFMSRARPRRRVTRTSVSVGSAEPMTDGRPDDRQSGRLGIGEVVVDVHHLDAESVEQ